VKSSRTGLAMLATGVLAAAVAGCGGGSKDNSSTAATGNATAAATSATDAGVAYAKAQIAKARAVPQFVAPGPPISDISKVKGKKIFVIPQQSDVSIIADVGKIMKGIAQQAGAQYIDCPNQGRPDQWAQCVNQAVAQKVDVIVLNFAPDPLVLQPQLAKAQAAGIPVVMNHLYDEGDALPPKVDAQVAVGFNRAARLEADWMIADSNGKANVLALPAMEVHPSKGIIDSIKDEFAKHCPACKLTTINIPLVDAATKTQSTVQSALVKDPTINYVNPTYDFAVQYVAPAITAARATGKVKVVTWNGTDFALKMLKQGQVSMDVGEAPDWLGWANMDQIFRVLAGDKPVANEHTAQRVWDSTNIAQAGNPPGGGVGYGDAYKSGYEKLWNLQISQ
jgi:ribose transport system substrate-binding protein